MKNRGIDLLIREAQLLKDEMVRTSSRLKLFSEQLSEEVEKLKEESDVSDPDEEENESRRK